MPLLHTMWSVRFMTLWWTWLIAARAQCTGQAVQRGPIVRMHMKQTWYVQINLFQKHLFLHQLTQNMTKDCSLNYKFSTWKFQAQNMLCTQIVFCFCIDNSKQFMYTTCSELVVFMHWTGKLMNNLLSYFGLVDVKINAFDKDLHVQMKISSLSWLKFLRFFTVLMLYSFWVTISCSGSLFQGPLLFVLIDPQQPTYFDKRLFENCVAP